MDPSTMSMLSGAYQGVQQGNQGSVMPSGFQPQGAPANRIDIQSLKTIVDAINKFASLLNSQGQTQLATDLYKSATQINTVLSKLEKGMTQGNQQ
jgi:hypothetical protein